MFSEKRVGASTEYILFTLNQDEISEHNTVVYFQKWRDFAQLYYSGNAFFFNSASSP